MRITKSTKHEMITPWDWPGGESWAPKRAQISDPDQSHFRGSRGSWPLPSDLRCGWPRSPDPFASGASTRPRHLAWESPVCGICCRIRRILDGTKGDLEERRRISQRWMRSLRPCEQLRIHQTWEFELPTTEIEQRTDLWFFSAGNLSMGFLLFFFLFLGFRVREEREIERERSKWNGTERKGGENREDGVWTDKKARESDLMLSSLVSNGSETSDLRCGAHICLILIDCSEPQDSYLQGLVRISS